MIWVMLAASLLIWVGWIAAITFLTEPLANRMAPLVYEWWNPDWGDEWHVSFCVAAILVAVFSGLLGIGLWALFMGVVM